MSLTGSAGLQSQPCQLELDALRECRNDGVMSDFPGFPDGFLFGTSTASYQIEGAVDADGRGLSVWDTFSARPGTISDGSTGAVACDHYHRYAEDVGLMKQLGAGAYRFSISWPRIQPEGSGAPNPAGLDFYDRLVDELVGAGIEPMATLFHWDLPQALQDGGGWQNRDTAERLAEYAAIVGERLADRVVKWVPVNEPNVVTTLGHGAGEHAPGLQLGLGALTVAHHLNLAHGLAVPALRAVGAKQVGTATNHHPIWAASDSDADQQARDFFDGLWNGIFAEPVLLGRYPELFAELMPATAADDLPQIQQPIDFYGFNYYNPMLVKAPAEVADLPFELVPELPGYPTTDFGWPVVPAGLREVFDMLVELTPDLPPIFITENGCAINLGPDEAGVVDDQRRIDYLDAHLRVVSEAIADGIDIGGYYCWSLLDNFEWAEGYSQRFGLVHIDYDTLVRTPKRSFEWYAALIDSTRTPM